MPEYDPDSAAYLREVNADPPDEGEHSAADAPPSAIDTALSWRKADCAPALPLELAAADALEEAADALLDVADGTASYHDLEGSLERIVAILRGGLGDDA